MRTINNIIIHCTDTYARMDIGVPEITEWHTARGFDTCGYHDVIRRDGTIEPGRDENTIGAHCLGQNEHSLGVAIVGGKADDGMPCVNFTAAQWKSLEQYCLDKSFKYNAAIEGHSDYSAKTCPNFDVKAWAETVGD